jgi:hypothetical protein
LQMTQRETQRNPVLFRETILVVDRKVFLNVFFLVGIEGQK